MASNPFDRRRVNGPEETSQPVYDVEEVNDLTLWKPGQPRPGRPAKDIRPIFMHPGLINQANGSAYIETEKTKIACAVYGPRQSKNTAYNETGRLNVEVKFAPFSCSKRRAPMRDAEDRSIGVAIHQALVSAVRLEMLPKSTIDIFVTILETDGLEATIASGIIAASTALADAGIEMIGLVTACSGAFIDQEIWLDPTNDESAMSRGTMVLACVPALNLITSIWQTGQIHPQEAVECMESCQELCTTIHSIVAQSLLDRIKNT